MQRRKISVFSTELIDWGENTVRATETAVAKCTHGIVIVSPDLADTEAMSSLVTSLTQKAQEKFFTLLPLRMKGVTEEQMQRLFPFMSIYRSFSVLDEKDNKCVEGVVSKLEDKISRDMQQSKWDLTNSGQNWLYALARPLQSPVMINYLISRKRRM